MLLPQSYQYPNLSECADRVAGQLRGDKECPFSGVTKSGRVWRKVLESGARSVRERYTQTDRHRHRHTYTQTHSDTDTYTDTDTDRHIHTDTYADTDIGTQSHTQTQTSLYT